MKNYDIGKGLLLIVLLFVLYSCHSDPFVDEETLTALEQGPSFVRFDNGLDEVINVNETDGPQALRLEYLFPVASDITVTYTFEGSAEFGVDFSVDGASSSGGNIDLVHDASSTQISFVDIVVDVLMDGVTDGDKTLIVTIADASAADGTAVVAGQGNLFKAITINIADADCSSDLAGVYNYTGSGFLDGAAGTVEIMAQGTNGNYVISDFAGLAFGDPAPYEFSVVCGIISAPAASLINEGFAATIIGSANEDTKEIQLNVVLNCCGGEGLVWGLNLTPR